jgi:BirA family biotin operon repressor/biotin-[acetyl-CoA-carboxylase] ligase
MRLLTRRTRVRYFKFTPSTSDDLEEMHRLRCTRHGDMVLTNYQTAGRGQVGNRWESDDTKNALFSMIFYPKTIAAHDAFLIAIIAAQAIRDTVAALGIDDVSVKWPNDVYWKDKKLAGILVENTLMGDAIEHSIVGVGLNVNQDAFPDYLPNPVSLTLITGETYDFVDIALTTATRIRKTIDAVTKKSLWNNPLAQRAKIYRRYNEQLYRTEGFHDYEDAHGRFSARIVRVEHDGRLVLEDTEGAVRSYLFKEVSFVL